MTFSFWPIEFANHLTTAINKVRSQLLGGTPPRFLFHYTSGDAVEKIANTGVLWATSVAEFKDKTEIHYGANLLREEVNRARKAGLRDFRAEVLSRIPEEVIARIGHI